MDLFTQASLGADAETILNQKHPDQQLRINRWAARVAVEVCEMRPDTGQINGPINRAQQVILWNMAFQRKLVEQRCPRLLPRSHHRKSLLVAKIESATYTSIKPEFFNTIGPNLHETIFHLTQC